MRKIVAWSLCAVWDNGDEEIISDVPTHVMRTIDEFLDTLEQNQEELENE
jgi:hypothetical protein